MPLRDNDQYPWPNAPIEDDGPNASEILNESDCEEASVGRIATFLTHAVATMRQSSAKVSASATIEKKHNILSIATTVEIFAEE